MIDLETRLHMLQKTTGAKLAEKAAKDTEFDAMLDTMLNAIEQQRISTAWMLLHLRRLYADELAGFPVPDSGRNNDGKIDATANNADWYLDDAGNKRSVLNDFFDSLPHGINCLKHLEYASAAKRGKRAPKEYGGIKYAGMSVREAHVHQNRWKARQDAGRKLLRKSIQLELQFGRFKEELAALNVELYLVDGKLTSSPTPIVVTDRNDGTRYRLLAVGTFLNIDVAEVLERGGNWEALFAFPEADDDEEDDASLVAENELQRVMDLIDNPQQADRATLERLHDALATAFNKLEDYLKESPTQPTPPSEPEVKMLVLSGDTDREKEFIIQRTRSEMRAREEEFKGIFANILQQ
jgi:hypothetical protein